jgi:hypothetical protein
MLLSRYFCARKLMMYAATLSRSSCARIRWGIVAWSELWNHTMSARSLMPGMSATALKLGAVTLGDMLWPRPTAWHSAQFFLA